MQGKKVDYSQEQRSLWYVQCCTKINEEWLQLPGLVLDFNYAE